MDVPAGSEPYAMQPGDPGYDVMVWQGELERARAAFEQFEKDGDTISKRYALDGEHMRKGVRFNILWSNVETLAPALYAKAPKIVAARRFLDKDPVGRIASRIIQRAVQYQIDGGEIHEATKMAVLDRLLPGRGQVWLRYEPTIEGGEGDDEADDATDNDAEGEAAAPGVDAAPADPGKITAEVVHVDYVHWKDFRHDPARTWDEVAWVARRAYLTQPELVKRFGDKVGSDVPLLCGPDGEKSDGKRGATEAFRKAEVWEIWDKSKREAVWIAAGCEETLDVRDDPYRLEGFYPCPKPLYATITNGSLVPVADYLQYKSQAESMDTLSGRKDKLVEAMKVRGAYDAAAPEIARILKADENDLVAVDRWEQFAASKGLAGSIDWLPLEMFGKAIEALSKEKAEIKADIFETTGISDILRGQGDPDETATGVQTKGHFATLRLKNRQADVARFVRDTVRIMAEMTCELFQPETLAEMASCQEMDELQIPAPMPPAPQGAPMMGHNGGPPLLGAPGPAPQPPTMAPGGPPMQAQHLPMMAGAAPGIGR